MASKKEEVTILGETRYFYYKIGLSTREISLSYLSNDSYKLDILCWGEWYVKRYKNVSSIKKYLKRFFSLNDEQIKSISKIAYELKRGGINEVNTITKG